MDPATLRELVEILGSASSDITGMLWAFVVLQYLYAAFEGFCVLVLFWAIYRTAKFAVAKEFWKHI